MPPIFQPEVGARAVYFAAHNTRREVDTGFSTMKALIGNMVAPGLLDRYLARTGYGAQQTSSPVDPDRHDNLWQPLAGDHGMHGTFDQRARDFSPGLWAVEHQPAVAAGLVGLATVLFGVLTRARR